MNLLSVHGLAKTGREKPLFTDVTFGLNEGEKAALIGRNGTGKSTLLNTIAGILSPDEGTVVFSKEAGVSFLPQIPLYSRDDTIRQHVFKSKSPKLQTIREYEEACAELEKNGSPAAQKKFSLLNEKMDKGNLWNYESQIQSILTTLGLNGMNRKMGELSGGMIKKVALAQVLVEDTKILLLDEPTNDFDIFTMNILEQFLVSFQGCLLAASHDRCFMDKICGSLFVLEDDGSVSSFAGTCSEYIECKMQKEAEKKAEEKNSGKKSAPGQSIPHSPQKKKKMTFSERKEFELLEQQIFALEDRKGVLEAELSSGIYERLQAAAQEYGTLTEKLAASYARWEELAELEQ